MNVDDLDGAKPRQKRVLATRESNRISDIVGACPKTRRHRQLFANYDNMNYADVTAAGRKSTREVDP
jgi:hypothetical protein